MAAYAMITHQLLPTEPTERGTRICEPRSFDHWQKGNPSPTWGRPPKPARCLTALHDASGLSASW